MNRILVNADGSENSFEVDSDSALIYAKTAAEAFVVGEDHEDAEFNPKLAKAALKKTKKHEEEGNP